MITLNYEGNTYTVTAHGNLLGIEKTYPDNSFIRRWYKVVDDYEFTYKIQKTQIRAARGANGLLEHFEWCIEKNFAIGCWVVDALNNILDNVKPVRR